MLNFISDALAVHCYYVTSLLCSLVVYTSKLYFCFFTWYSPWPCPWGRSRCQMPSAGNTVFSRTSSHPLSATTPLPSQEQTRSCCRNIPNIDTKKTTHECFWGLLTVRIKDQSSQSKMRIRYLHRFFVYLKFCCSGLSSKTNHWSIWEYLNFKRMSLCVLNQMMTDVKILSIANWSR